VVNVYDALDLGLLCQILELRKVHTNAMFLVGSTMRVFGSEMVKLTAWESKVSRVKLHHPAWGRRSAIPRSRGSNNHR
jgi:hypothetical protein